MKITKFKRALSVLLVAVMVISALPLNAIGTDGIQKAPTPGDTTNDFWDDLWDLLNPSKPRVKMSGLPDNAEGSIEIVANPFENVELTAINNKDIVAFYDLKAVDSTTGEIVHPTGEVEVTISNVNTSETDLFVLHLLDSVTAIKNAKSAYEITDPAFVSAFPNEAKAAEEATGKTGIIMVEELSVTNGKLEVKTNSLNKSKQSLTFKTDSFSIYLIGEEEPKITVNFYNGSNKVETLYISERLKDHIDTIIYDPGAGTIPQGKSFIGWSTEQNYNENTTALTIADIRNTVSGMLNGLTADVTLNYYAMVMKLFRITYLDENEVSLNTLIIRSKDSETIQYTVNQAFTPGSGDMFFEGWLVHSGPDHITGHTDGTVYPNGTVVTLSGDVTFSVNAPRGHWLVFDENAKGATYVAPQFVKSSETTKAPTVEMTKLGYTFGGWYTNKECTGNQFVFGQPLTENVTIYAKWTAATTAGYTIIIWKQNVNGETYDFAESVTGTGRVGTNIPFGNTTSRSYPGFHLKENPANVEIVPEGNAVAEVYYDRTEYTLTFIDESASSNAITYVYGGRTYSDATVGNEITNTSNINTLEENKKTISGYEVSRYGGQGNRTYAIKINGKWYQITAEGRYVWEASSITSVPSNANGVVKTITALYEQNISDNFPIVGTNGVTYDNGERWMPQSNNQGWNKVMVFIETMPAESVTFRLDVANRPLKTMYYYVEALPTDTQNVVTRNGVRYVLYNTVRARYNGVTTEDFVALDGFTKQVAAGTVNGSSLTPDNSGFYIYNTSSDQDIYFFYSRDSYPINFMDGSYYDGNGNRLDSETGLGQIEVTDNIIYGANIAQYNSHKPSVTRPGYVFEGWYTDDKCTHEYTFTTLPKGGITVFAKWRQIQYRVFLHPNAGTDTTLYWGSDDQAMNFRISYGGKVSAPTGTRGEYEFVGWFTDPACTQVFNADAFILNETTVTAAYDKTSDMTDPMDKWGNGATWNSDAVGYNGGDRFWITKKLDLYGKWRKILVGAPGINIEYDYNGGSGNTADTGLYVDDSTAIAGAAVTAPDENKVFEYWIVQRWDEEQGKFVDTDVKVYPGGEFTVLKDNARQTENEGSTAEHPSFTYTVRLKAYFGPKDTVRVNVTFDSNGGTFKDSVKTDDRFVLNDGKTQFVGEGIVINSPIQTPKAADIEKVGFKFLGWAFDKNIKTQAAFNEAKNTVDGEGNPAPQAFDADVTVAADEKNGFGQNTDANTLYAVWEVLMIPVEIKKAWTGDEEQDAQTFVINLSLDRTVDGRGIERKENGTVITGVTSVSLEVGDSETVYVPYGTTLTVSENPGAKYVAPVYQAVNGTNGTLTGSNGSYEVKGVEESSAGTVTVTNELKRVKVVIEKEVNGDTQDHNATFTFDLVSSFGYVMTESGDRISGSVTVKEGEPLTVTIPYGAALTVTETGGGVSGRTYTTTASAATGSYSADSKSYTTGNLESATTDAAAETVTFTNTREVTVTVTKTIAEGDAAYVGNDTFTFGFTGKDDFTLDPDDETNKTKTFTLPYGTKFTLTEKDLNTAKYGIAKFDGSAAATEIAAIYSKEYTANGDLDITVENNVRKYNVTLEKVVTVPAGYENVAADTSHEFTVKVVSDNTAFTVSDQTIKVGENAVIKNVPYGVKLTLTEQNRTDGRYEYVSGNGGYTITGDTTVTFTNERKFVDVTVTKVLDSKLPSDVTRDYTFTYSYTDGTTVTGEGSFIINVNGQPEASGEYQGKYVGVDSTTVKVPAGASLTVSETNSGGFETPDGTTKTTSNVTADPKYVFTNERDVVDVRITKTVDSTVDSDKTGKYSFNYTYSYVDGQNVVVVNKTETIDLSGEGAHEILIQNVPKNATGFVITETAASGTTLESAGAFITTSATATGATGTPDDENRRYEITKITGDVVVVNFKNTRETVDITIEKKVENEKAAVLKEKFTFNVNKQDGGYTFKIGGEQKNSAEFKLAHGDEPVTITVPRGVDVVIEETANNNYTTAITGETSTNGLTATVTTNATTESYTVTYTNTRKPITVNVTKVLDNLGMSDSWNGFAFPISYKIDNGEWIAIKDGVKAGETKTVEVPYGSMIEIKELVDEKNGGLAIKDYFNIDGTMSIGSVTTEGQTLTIKNTRKTVPVKVTKEVVSRITADNSRDYEFTITTNSTDQTYASQTVTIKGAGSATKDVPKGANVKVTETNADTTVFKVEYKDGETYQTGSSKTVNNVTASTEFVIKNTRKEYDLTISKTVNNFEASGDNVYPVTYTITYTEGGNTQLIVKSTINFKKGDRSETVKVPYGCKVEVSENTAASVTINGKDYLISEAFDTTVNGKTTTSHTIDSMTQNEVVNVVNTRKTQTVTVHKVVNNEWGIDADKTATFKIKINNGEAETIQVENNEWSNVYTVYYGDAFTAKETEDPAFNTKVGYANNSLANGNSKNIENVDKDSKHDIWFENTRKEIVVTVHKIVTDPAEQNEKFKFTAELKFGNQSLTLPDAVFELMNYGTATGSYKEKQITIPYGASIKVAENNYAPRYSSTSHITVEGESKTGYSQDYKVLTKNALIEVTNDRQWLYIPVSKVLVAKGATKDANIEFEFTWKYKTAEGTVEGSEALKLKGGETKDNVVRVPIGSTVTITETDISLEAYYTGKKVSDIFTTTNNHGSDKVATLTDVQATNDNGTPKDNTVTFTNTHKTVEVFLQKTVAYDYDKNTDFTFTYSGIDNGIAEGSTTRKHNAGSVQLVEIPVGTGIEVKETSVTGFSTTAVVNNTTYVLGDGNAVRLDAIYEETSINYTNTRKLVDVVIKKEVVNKGITADNNIQFKFDAAAQFDADHTIVLADTDKTFNLAHGGSHTIKVPYGATVTVTEDTSMTLEGYNNVSVKTVFDTVKAVNVFENVTENVSATVTNTHKDVSVKVTKAVVGLDLDKNIEFEFMAEAVRGNDKVTLDNFKLKGADGSKDKILTIPYGTTLTVTEKTENTLSEYGNAKVSDVFTTTNDTYTFQPAVDSTQTVTVTNTHKTVQVTVTKTVEGVAGIDDKILYPMTITSVKGAEKAAIEGVDENNGFKLNGITEGADKQNTKTFVVYYGTDVTVNELINTQLTKYAGKKISDVFTTTNATKVISNITADTNVEVTNKHNTVTVTVKKIVDSEDPNDHTKDFNFKASAKVGDVETLTAGDCEFKLQDFSKNATLGQKEITVYYGASFNVDEVLGDEASKYIVTVNGEKNFVAYANTTTVTFNNKRAAGNLTITKTVTGKTTSDAFVFEITKVDDKSFAPLYVTIHPETPEGNNGYGSVTIKQLEAGKYTVRELDNWSWAYDVVDEKVKSATIVGGDQKQVNFTNKDKETNWLRDETSNENSFTNSVPADDTAKSVEAVAWDSKFRLSYAAPVGKFEDKETA